MFGIFKKNKSPSGLTAYEQNIIDKIDEHGWMATHVFDPEAEDPGFTYSIGFPKTLDVPDFIIFGLPQELMHNMLWEIFHQIKKGKSVEDHTRWEGLLGGDYICVSRRVHLENNTSNYFNSARWHHRHIGRSDEDLEFYQIFWPGTKIELLPWEEGCHQSVIDVQPLLFEPGHDYS